MFFTLIYVLRGLWVHFSRSRWDLVLHKSENFLVVNKRPDTLINSNDPNISTALHTELLAAYPSLQNPKLKHHFHFVHRLDFATSGVLCLALHKKAASAAAASFANRKSRKYYIAIVRGHVASELLDIVSPIGAVASETKTSKRMCVAAENQDCISVQSAWTRILVLERGTYDWYPATKVLIRPITGRRHQIRVHCSHLGHTIVGDFTYSLRKDVTPHRMFLHALRLVLPNTIEPLDVSTPDPFASCQNWKIFETINELHSGYEKLDSIQQT